MAWFCIFIGCIMGWNGKTSKYCFQRNVQQHDERWTKVQIKYTR